MNINKLIDTIKNKISSFGVTPQNRVSKLRRLLSVKKIVRILETHNSLAGLIVENLNVFFSEKKLQGKNAVVTAGPSIEKIDHKDTSIEASFTIFDSRNHVINDDELVKIKDLIYSNLENKKSPYQWTEHKFYSGKYYNANTLEGLKSLYKCKENHRK